VELPEQARTSLPGSEHKLAPIDAPKDVLPIHSLMVCPLSSTLIVSTSSNASLLSGFATLSMLIRLSVIIYFLEKIVSVGLRVPLKF
jgi:Na+-translocating ferredoxin:NAD+ oxidoreductase RnfE subunit